MVQTLISRELKTGMPVGLPVSWYFDPEILEIERRELFAAGPTYASHARAVQNEGEYRALGGQQLGRLLVRHNGRTQLVSNVCRHRQAEMLSGAGRVKNIVCPVHNWAYDLDGRQLAAPQFAENPCLDLERSELTEWNGLLFEQRAWSRERGARRMNSVLPAPCSVPDVTDYVLERVDEEEHDLNWKAFLEVYLEDYHIGVVHPGFRVLVDPNDLRAALQAVGGERSYCEQVSVRWPLPTAGTPVFAEFQKILTDVLAGRRPPFAAIWLCLFSGQLLEWYPFSFIVTTYAPLSPTRTRLRSEYYFDRQIAETRRDYVQAGLAVLDEVTGEDHAAATALQNGRRALYERGDALQGPYQMPMEQGLRRFHECLRAIVQNA